jgi:hypothetical protein
MRAASFLLLVFVFVSIFVLAEHALEQAGADFFEALHGLINRGLVFNGEYSLDIAQTFGNFADGDLDVLEMLVRLYGGIATLFRIGDDFVDRCSGVLDITCLVEFVGVAELKFGDPDAKARAILRGRVLDPGLEFVYGFVPGGGRAGREGEEKHPHGKTAHNVQCFLGSIAIRR